MDIAGRHAARAALLGLLLGAAAAVRADVYLTEAADGVPVYSSEPRSPASRLLLGDAPAPPGRVGFAPAARESASTRRQRERLEPQIAAAAAGHGLDPALLRAVIHVESRFNPRAISAAGAVGAMQLMPATARRLGVADRADPRQNIDAGARHLRALIDRFGGNQALALAAYNAGEPAVLRHAVRVPPYRETLTYVPEVLARADDYRAAAEGSRD